MLILNMHIACLACGTVKTLYKSITLSQREHTGDELEPVKGNHNWA
jgi:hypothetical protein